MKDPRETSTQRMSENLFHQSGIFLRRKHRSYPGKWNRLEQDKITVKNTRRMNNKHDQSSQSQNI